MRTPGLAESSTARNSPTTAALEVNGPQRLPTTIACQRNMKDARVMISLYVRRASLETGAGSPRRLTAIVIGVAALVGFVGPTYGQDSAADPVIAIVDNTEIHASDLAMAEREAGRIPVEDEQGKREYLLRYLSDMILLADAAEKEKIGDETELRRRITFARNKALMEMLLQHAAKAAITDEALRKAYDEAVQRVGTEQEFHLRAILVRIADPKDAAVSNAAEAKANAAAQRVKNGEDFAVVADELSEAPGHKGGDIGYLTKAEMGREFFTAVSALNPGDVSAPFKSQVGWHVLKVEDKRSRLPPEFEKVRDKMELYVSRKAQLDLVARLRSAAKIQRLDQPAANEPAK
jgi:peptidyl-prolyl cis-trans isomerase C